MVKCRACGMDLRPGARFCDRCGTKVEKICPACGAVLRDQARFCDLCGVPLEGAVPVSRPKAQKGSPPGSCTPSPSERTAKFWPPETMTSASAT